MPAYDLPTRSYARVRELRRRGRLPAATGPCEVPGCEARTAQAGPAEAARTRYLYEHCHQHDYIRGVTCQRCNPALAYIDARVLMPIGWHRPARAAALLEFWSRCPSCAALGPWAPVMTLDEYAECAIGRRIRELPRLLESDPAACQAAADLAHEIKAQAARAARRRYRIGK